MFVGLLMMLHPTEELEPPANPEPFSRVGDAAKFHVVGRVGHGNGRRHRPPLSAEEQNRRNAGGIGRECRCVLAGFAQISSTGNAGFSFTGSMIAIRSYNNVKVLDVLSAMCHPGCLVRRQNSAPDMATRCNMNFEEWPHVVCGMPGYRHLAVPLVSDCTKLSEPTGGNRVAGSAQKESGTFRPGRSTLLRESVFDRSGAGLQTQGLFRAASKRKCRAPFQLNSYRSYKFVTLVAKRSRSRKIDPFIAIRRHSGDPSCKSRIYRYSFFRLPGLPHF